MRILGTGLTGLVGSRIVELLSDRHEFENVSRSTGIDITDKEQVTAAIENSNASLVLHLAAKADVDGCERDRAQGVSGDAWLLNVTATKYISEACNKTGKKLIYVSTDFVFDGENTPDGGYTEDHTPHPVNWYAKTKYEGEKVVAETDSEFLIVRPAYPYRNPFPAKNDFVQAILSRLQQGQELFGVTDHIMTPTFIDDFAYALQLLIQHNASGIYHTVGSQFITPFDAVKLIASTYAVEHPLLHETTRKEFFENRANRPFNLSLSNAKIESLGGTMHSFSEGLHILKNQL